MKKKRLIALFSTLIFISLAGCGSETKWVHLQSKESTEQSSIESTSEEKMESSSSERTESSKDMPTSEMENDANFSLMIEASQSQIPMLKEQGGDLYKNISIEEGKDSTIIYNYQFSQAPATKVDVDALKPTMIKGMKPVLDQMKGLFPEIKIQVNYLNPDGSEVVSFTITQEEIDQLD